MSAQNIWSTIKIEETLSRIENGLEADMSCFHEGDITLRKAYINFQYTKEEQKIIARCMKDIHYFASFCQVMTDDGIRKIKLRDYQKEILTNFAHPTNRYNILLASRQIGKCQLFTTKVTIKNRKTDEIFETSIGNLYYGTLSQIRKLTIFERLKWKLWNWYSKLLEKKQF